VTATRAVTAPYGRLVRGPLSFDDVEELELAAEKPEQRRTAAARLVAWSDEPHPEDDAEVTPAMLLAHAGELLTTVGDHEAALDLYRRAAAAEGDVVPDVRCYLHHGLIAVGDLDAARRLAEEVRRSRPTDADVYALIGEDYEAVGDLVEANRWMNLGLRRLTDGIEDPDEAPPDVVAALLLTARRRVRQALGFPPDEFDLMLPPQR
jgi:tetratricopeptide (TPR) repeat protein